MTMQGTCGGKQCSLTLIVHRGTGYNGGPPTIIITFYRNGNPFSQSGIPNHTEDEEALKRRLFSGLKEQVLNTAQAAKWLGADEIATFFDSFGHSEQLITIT